jgi:hypothetical protein
MAIFNIKTQVEYNVPKAFWDTGNSRESIDVVPDPIPSDYTSCVYSISENGVTVIYNKCRPDTEAWHAAFPNEDLLFIL